MVCKTKGTKRVITQLERATIDFIEEDLVPKLSKKELNVIGFTLTNEQVYASLFCYLYLVKHYPQYKKLFIFGGGMMSFPRIPTVLRKFGVSGLAVLGEGELKLERIVRVCKEHKASEVDLIISKCSKDIPDVHSIESLTDEELLNIKPGKELELKSIEELPLPDYTEYFGVLRRFAADEEVYLALKDRTILLLDGSRGCSYAKCDFCGLNASWCSYRRKSAKRIYELLTDALVKFSPFNIQFSDNLCDVWISEFCDLLLQNKIVVPDLGVDLRAIHDEEFYVKLSLIGCTQLQVGVEALSGPLLQKMNKGTTLLHNVQSMKYLQEVNIKNGGNLITDHPGSDVGDIKQTKEILVTLSHLGKFDLTNYTLAEHSTIYNSLSPFERKNLKQINVIKMPPEAFEFFTDDPLLPSSRDISAKVKRAWSEFKRWYEGRNTEAFYLNVCRVSVGTILIKDSRFGKIEEHVYSGDAERVYTQCHKGQTVEQLNKETGIGASNVQKILDSFVKKRLMISSNGRYLSIALRPKEELINNYYLQRSKVMC
jgi:radical SAM superfamily enzyme YgiQ (UPF0313 family)